MAEVVDTHAVVDPRAVMVMLRDTSSTRPTVLASQWLSNHALNAEIVFVKHPQAKELLNYRSLLVPARQFRNVAGIFKHRNEVEVCSQPIKYAKYNIVKRM